MVCDIPAVDGVSFEVEKGEIFGLLGPNGAGKTTLIRVILDIFKADAGKVEVLGGPMSEAKKNCIGYLPEERGLYQDIDLERCITYLASLKGLSAVEIRPRLDSYLKRFDLAAYRRKKVKELSKGMQQKAQLIVTLLHQPEIIIIDEPFSGLDPVNTQMVKDLLREVRDAGTAVIMSTHQMHQVEELCDRLVLIHHGKAVLYGTLDEIRSAYSGRDLDVRSSSPLPGTLPGVENVLLTPQGARLRMTPNGDSQEVLRALMEANVRLEGFEIAIPTLDEIFIQVVTGGGQVDG
jgi:ABC-2 type transport system ATP-binding protein